MVVESYSVGLGKERTVVVHTVGSGSFLLKKDRGETKILT